MHIAVRETADHWLRPLRIAMRAARISNDCDLAVHMLDCEEVSSQIFPLGPPGSSCSERGYTA